MEFVSACFFSGNFGKSVSSTTLSSDVVRLQQENGRNIGYLVGVHPLGKMMKKLREINIWGLEVQKVPFFAVSEPLTF